MESGDGRLSCVADEWSREPALGAEAGNRPSRPSRWLMPSTPLCSSRRWGRAALWSRQARISISVSRLVEKQKRCCQDDCAATKRRVERCVVAAAQSCARIRHEHLDCELMSDVPVVADRRSSRTEIGCWPCVDGRGRRQAGDGAVDRWSAQRGGRRSQAGGATRAALLRAAQATGERRGAQRSET